MEVSSRAYSSASLSESKRRWSTSSAATKPFDRTEKFTQEDVQRKREALYWLLDNIETRRGGNPPDYVIENSIMEPEVGGKVDRLDPFSVGVVPPSIQGGDTHDWAAMIEETEEDDWVKLYLDKDFDDWEIVMMG